MADSKISDLSAASTLAGTEVLPVVQSTTTKKATITQVLAAAIAKSIGTTQGDIIYWTAADTPARLAKGTAFQRLRMNAGATAPEWANPIESFGIAVGDETTTITTGTAKVTWRMPYAFTLTGVRANLNTVSSSGTPTVDINEGGTTILSTKLTIDASELTSVTAAVPAVMSDTALADDAEITIDIDVAGTGAKGLKVWLIGYRAE